MTYRLVCGSGHRWREVHPVATLVQCLRSSRTQAVRIQGYGLPHVASCPRCGGVAVNVARVPTPA